ncbi:hypothetical protein C8R44DRAFT_775296 [Mycena epipterygia]|nr:hypothetical protein C8R44DRAFT_775296 [Mycena epipterygia]
MPWEVLPFELVSKIFTHCLPVDGLLPLSFDELPLLFVRVCRSWKDVAMATPALWTSIRVSPSRYRTSRAMVARWIQASGTAPLDIGIHTLISDDHHFFEPALSQKQRWRVLDVDLLDLSFLVNGPLPSLQTITVRGEGIFTDGMCFTDTPNLTTVIWKTLLDITRFPLPYPQLTHIKLADFTIPSTRCRRLLQMCPSLVELSVKVLDSESEYSMLTHPELRHLDVHAPSGAYLFLRALTLPNLEYLSYNLGYYRLNPIQTSQLVSFFEHSCHKLESLKLSDTYIESGEAAFLLASLPHLPLLRELSILPSGSFDARCGAFSAFHLSNELFEALTSGRILPNLQHISFHSCTGFTDAAFVDMVCARWWPDGCLRTVDVGLDHALDTEQLARLRACRDAGLQLPHWDVLVAGPRTREVRREVVLVSP